MPNVLDIEPLDPLACAPYGVMLGTPALSDDPATYLSPASDYWRTHLFAPGDDQPAEILWVIYRKQPATVARLEAHLLTQQAIVPLTGPIVQIVATSNAEGLPDPATLRAFEIAPGTGLCMHPRTWHATRVEQPEVTCLMLTRPSTTRDLTAHLIQGKSLVESSIAQIPLYELSDRAD
ncbi:ureidoglycolate lyase [Caballeronia sp. GAFFF2]|uniref:ureidoglycolate lyase n=1 Tax=Caballeronia sp. GAFFF2 TaxID=2921741 RepID=UPI002028A67D|nr:ureidoglycolate lyase [Caballeronia sp. GAFFF2]